MKAYLYDLFDKSKFAFIEDAFENITENVRPKSMKECNILDLGNRFKFS